MHYISMRIAGEKLDFDRINNTLKVENATWHKRGDIVLYNNEKITFEEDIWQTKLEIDNNSCIEDKLEEFIDRLSKDSSFINKLSLNNDISLWLTIYSENIQLNFRLSHSMIRDLYEMGISFDLSIMNLEKLYNE